VTEFLYFIHILSAAAWFGAALVRNLGGRAMRADNAAAAAWFGFTVNLARVVQMPAAVLLFITGFGLIGLQSEVYSMTDLFVIIGILMTVAGAALGMAVFGPAGRLAASAYQRGDRPAGREAAARIAWAGWADAGLVAFTILAMVLKWGA